MNEKIKGIIADILVLLCIVLIAIGVYVTEKDMTKAPDPFAKCIKLPSSDKANYWRCEK